MSELPLTCSMGTMWLKARSGMSPFLLELPSGAAGSWARAGSAGMFSGIRYTSYDESGHTSDKHVETVAETRKTEQHDFAVMKVHMQCLILKKRSLAFLIDVNRSRQKNRPNNSTTKLI